jgi:hypothetical protein
MQRTLLGIIYADFNKTCQLLNKYLALVTYLYKMGLQWGSILVIQESLQFSKEKGFI